MATGNKTIILLRLDRKIHEQQRKITTKNTVDVVQLFFLFFFLNFPFFSFSFTTGALNCIGFLSKQSKLFGYKRISSFTPINSFISPFSIIVVLCLVSCSSPYSFVYFFFSFLVWLSFLTFARRHLPRFVRLLLVDFNWKISKRKQNQTIECVVIFPFSNLSSIFFVFTFILFTMISFRSADVNNNRSFVLIVFSAMSSTWLKFHWFFLSFVFVSVFSVCLVFYLFHLRLSTFFLILIIFFIAREWQCSSLDKNIDERTFFSKKNKIFLLQLFSSKQNQHSNLFLTPCICF